MRRVVIVFALFFLAFSMPLPFMLIMLAFICILLHGL